MTYIHETAILDPGAEIGENTKIWHFTHIMSKAKIGESVSVGPLVIWQYQLLKRADNQD